MSTWTLGQHRFFYAYEARNLCQDSKLLDKSRNIIYISVQTSHISTLTVIILKATSKYKAQWRFSVLFFHSYYFLSQLIPGRSYVLERDAAAVREWLESGKTYHAIHDHPGNIAVLMGGTYSFFTSVYMTSNHQQCYFSKSWITPFSTISGYNFSITRMNNK